MKKRRDAGLLSLEASISLTIFIFLMLFMYSFFIVFEAQNAMANVILNTADSMALDTYSNGKLLDSGTITQAIFQVIYNNEAANGTGSDFVSHERWNKVLKNDASNIWDGSIYASSSYAAENGKTLSDGSERYVVSSDLSDAIKEKFVAYLANGSEAQANKLLKDRYNIEGGLDGLDFSHSYLAGGVLHLSVIYTINYEFDVFGWGGMKMEQKCCSKLWQ